MNISIAEERKCQEQSSSQSKVFRGKIKPQKPIHSMAEKKSNLGYFKIKIDQDALE